MAQTRRLYPLKKLVIWRDPRQANPPGYDRDLGTGKGSKRGHQRTQEMRSDTGTQHGAQSRAAKAGGCGQRPGGKGVSCQERRWRLGATKRCEMATNGY